MRGFIRRQGNPLRHNMKAKPMTVPANARILSAITKPAPAAPAPASKPADAKPDWTQLDPDTLSPELRKAYDDYKAANRAAQTARQVFEAMMTNAIDPLDTEKVIFGYNFGKLSLAIVPADKPKRRTAAVSLADYLASKA